MKKTLLVLFMMVALVGATFAVEAVVQGDAIATFGYDLETEASGFENSLDDFGVYFSFIDEASAFDNAGEGTYGSIEISDISMALWSDGSSAPYDNDDDSLVGTISAKIHSGNMFVGVYNTPDVDVNYAENFGSKTQLFDINSDSAWLGSTGGMSLGFDDGTNAVELSVSSVGDWDGDGNAAVTAVAPSWMTEEVKEKVGVGDTGVNTANKYVVGLTADLAFGDASVEAAVLYANGYWGDDAYTGFSVAPAYEMAISDAMGLEVSVGADVVMMPKDVMYAYDGKDTIYFDIAPALTFNLAAENEDEDRSNVAVGVYLAGASESDPDDNMMVNLEASFTEEHDGGLMDGLGASVTLVVLDLIDSDGGSDLDYMSYAVDASFDFDVMPGLTPSAGFGMGTNDNKTNLDLGLEMGSDFTGIANTTFNMDYTTASLTDADATDLVLTDVDAHAGVFTFMTTISW